jgi:hypothetical protein
MRGIYLWIYILICQNKLQHHLFSSLTPLQPGKWKNSVRLGNFSLRDCSSQHSKHCLPSSCGEHQSFMVNGPAAQPDLESWTGSAKMANRERLLFLHLPEMVLSSAVSYFIERSYFLWALLGFMRKNSVHKRRSQGNEWPNILGIWQNASLLCDQLMLMYCFTLRVGG